ncbi:MAG TPA: aldo/keto reductase, partial [Vibrio sp.]|nr:aldo/keto reductase [Vibrio sp.]
KKQCSVAQLSIAWTLAHPATTGTIIGARTRLQLKELLPAAEIILSPDELKQIDTFRHS